MNTLLSQLSLPGEYLAILPQLMLMFVGVLALFFSLTRFRQSPLAMYTVLWAQAGVLCFTIFTAINLPSNYPQALLGGMIHPGIGHDLASIALQSIALVIGWMSKRYSQKTHHLPLEFYGLLTAATVALIFLTQASHLVFLFISLEAASLFTVLLMAISNAKSTSTALKYLVQSGFSGVIMLWGIALVYMHTGTFQYAELSRGLVDTHSLGANIGVALILVGLLFKLGLFPFGYYLPSIYQHTCYPVLGFLATASKLAAGIALLGLLNDPFDIISQPLMPMLLGFVCVSLVWGALSAMHQSNIKRLLSLSGVVHAGFIVLALLYANISQLAFSTAFFYFLVYIPAVLLLFYCLIELNLPDLTLTQLKNTARRNPGFGILMCLSVASMAGLPPLGGFMAKFMALTLAISQGLWWVVGAMVVASVIALYYYLNMLFAIIGRHSDQPEAPQSITPIVMPISTRVFAGFMAFVIIVFGFFQGHISLISR